jgi:tRNA A37 threonylcarbamoyladenosine dehydratase
LARAGVGKLVLVDDDDICLTNINRQIHATRKTVGKAKVEAMRDRLLDINPKMEITTFKELYTAESRDRLVTSDLDYVVDAIDMVSSKLDLIMKCKELDVPVISCMGAGNKFDPTKLELADIYNTSICPLARVMRYELRKRGVKKLKVVYSKETPAIPLEIEKNCKNNCICTNKDAAKCTHRRQIPGSMSFVPSTAGLILASAVVNDILGINF